MKDLFNKRHPFSTAIEALRAGKRIRRASEKKGYAKLYGTDKSFITYWLEHDTTSSYCVFTMEDVLAEDWIID